MIYSTINRGLSSTPGQKKFTKALKRALQREDSQNGTSIKRVFQEESIINKNYLNRTAMERFKFAHSQKCIISLRNLHIRNS